jgi:hypothetical protein
LVTSAWARVGRFGSGSAVLWCQFKQKWSRNGRREREGSSLFFYPSAPFAYLPTISSECHLVVLYIDRSTCLQVLEIHLYRQVSSRKTRPSHHSQTAVCMPVLVSAPPTPEECKMRTPLALGQPYLGAVAKLGRSVHALV